MTLEHTKVYVEKKDSNEITVRAAKLAIEKMRLIGLLARIPYRELKEFVEKYRKYL